MANNPFYILKKIPADIPKFLSLIKIELLNVSTYNKLPQFTIEITTLNERSLDFLVKMVKGGKVKVSFRTTIFLKPYEGFEAFFDESKIEKKGFGIPKMLVENNIGQLKFDIKLAIDEALKGLE